LKKLLLFMGQQIQKVCQHKLGEDWKDGCCTDNPPVDNIFLKSNALAYPYGEASYAQRSAGKLTVPEGNRREGIASAVEQYPIVPTKSQQDLHPDTTDSNAFPTDKSGGF
jgi:hypothetical protein